ncbi:baculoviral IAP repeat-containing protein 7 isoform X4 [Macaca fascicularis]|uniref:baculoviral IAP repeat-containing protein 7 isoform X4 n=1 Tax=Macaca fascicularis TaxID=9541 RepID=UPI003D155541
MGPEDSAKCLRHGPQLCRWAAGDGPTRERCGPRSLGSPALGLDSCRAWDHVDGQILGQLRPLAEEEEEEGAGAMSPRGPAFPGMGSEELRLASFYDWPLTAGVPPELLAAAGFFHTASIPQQEGSGRMMEQESCKPFSAHVLLPDTLSRSLCWPSVSDCGT